MTTRTNNNAELGAGSEPVRRRPRLSTERSLSMQHNMTKILVHLYVGGEDSVDDVSALEFLGISHVINCTVDTPNYFKDKLKYLRIPVRDDIDSNIEKYFDEALAFIDEARSHSSACLIHCSHGMSRSATIALAYMIKNNNMTLREALKYTRNVRPVTSPNPGFMAKLVALEKLQHGTESLDVVKYKNNRFADVDQLIPDPVKETSVLMPEQGF